jgi:hypothetical protein
MYERERERTSAEFAARDREQPTVANMTGPDDVPPGSEPDRSGGNGIEHWKPHRLARRATASGSTSRGCSKLLSGDREESTGRDESWTIGHGIGPSVDVRRRRGRNRSDRGPRSRSEVSPHRRDRTGTDDGRGDSRESSRVRCGRDSVPIRIEIGLAEPARDAGQSRDSRRCARIASVSVAPAINRM